MVKLIRDGLKETAIARDWESCSGPDTSFAGPGDVRLRWKAMQLMEWLWKPRFRGCVCLERWNRRNSLWLSGGLTDASAQWGR